MVLMPKLKVTDEARWGQGRKITRTSTTLPEYAILVTGKIIF